MRIMVPYNTWCRVVPLKNFYVSQHEHFQGYSDCLYIVNVQSITTSNSHGYMHIGTRVGGYVFQIEFVNTSIQAENSKITYRIVNVLILLGTKGQNCFM